ATAEAVRKSRRVAGVSVMGGGSGVGCGRGPRGHMTYRSYGTYRSYRPGGNNLHHPVLRPGVAAAGEQLLVLPGGRVVDRLRVEGRVHRSQERGDSRVRVADPADLEVLAVHVEDVQPVPVDVDLAQGPQLPTRALEELQGQVEVAVEIVGLKWFGHGSDYCFV